MHRNSMFYYYNRLSVCLLVCPNGLCRLDRLNLKVLDIEVLEYEVLDV